jgi:dTDP-4-amino-4,6-dideoxygalactose transaminase
MDIPFFRYPQAFLRRREALEQALLSTASAGSYILQAEVREFEERLAEFCGVRHAIGVGNATDGLELILRSAGVGPGDEVILPSHTFVATAGAVVAAGATPVFAEIGPDHLLDPSDLEHRVTDRTRVLLPTQLNGRTAEMDRLREVAARHRLLLVEDSAQGLGSRFCGQMAGSFGRAGVFSFYPAKILGALGDGGAIVTDEDALAQQLRERRDHGRDRQTGEVLRWGRNSRLDNLQAAVLLVKLAHVHEELETRRRLARRYHEALQGEPHLHLPPPPDDSPQPRHYDVFQNYEIEADNRDRLRAFLTEHGVGTALQWGGKGVHQFPALGIAQSLPRTERALSRSLLLPMNGFVTDDEVDYIAERILAFYAGRQDGPSSLGPIPPPVAST